MLVAELDGLVFRAARPSDAADVAALHTDSWRRHYRGAYSDAFLDGDVAADRLVVWTDRLARSEPSAGTCTVLAERSGALVGFAHAVFDEDPEWGTLLDNLHVADGLKRRRIGSRLLSLTVQAVLDRPERTGLYLWVLGQNVDAQAFYRARGGRCVGQRNVQPPGGVPSRLVGAPVGLRYVWPDPSVLLGSGPYADSRG